MVSAPSLPQGTPGDTGVPYPSNICMLVIPKEDKKKNKKKLVNGDKVRPFAW